jgi:hypothetical protein
VAAANPLHAYAQLSDAQRPGDYIPDAEPSDFESALRSPTKPPANANSPLPGSGNLASAYVVPAWRAPLAQAQYAETRAADHADRYASRANRANAPDRGTMHRAQQLKNSTMKLYQLPLVASYSDAGASSPGFTVTGSISIGR